MQYADVIGQDSIKHTLRQLVEDSRLPHAMLLLGPAGSGALPLALATTQYLLCKHRQEGQSCGKCAPCLKAAKYIHPDVHFSFPTVGTNVTSDKLLTPWRQALLDNPYLDVNQWLQAIGADNKQGNINKDECQLIIRKLSLKTFEADVKVLVMWLPEYLGKEGNRLLKIIEEPPPGTHFILVAENASLILNTILSRCQLVKVPALTDAEIIAGLQMRHPELDAPQAQTIAHLADGNFNLALSLADNRTNHNASTFLDWLRKCFRGNGIELVQWVEQFASWGRESQKHFLQYGLHFMRELLVLPLLGQEQARLQEDELSTAQRLSQVLAPDQIALITQLFDACYGHVERNANPKILFLDTSIHLHKIMQRRLPELAQQVPALGDAIN